METLNAVLTIGLGVALGIGFWGVINTIVSIPAQIRKNRKRREMQKFMHEAMDGLVKHLESDEHKAHVKKGNTNAKQRSQKAKTSTRSKSTAGTKKATVQKAKKGVSNANKR